MKLYFTNQRMVALTRIDAVVAVLLTGLLFAILFAVLLPVQEAERQRAERINCVGNLKQINLALRIREEDNNNQYPMSTSSNGGETISTIGGGGLNSGEQAWIDSIGISNTLTLDDLKILHCPADTNSNDKISYFLNLDASEVYPQMILDGDDNLTISGVPVKPGILDLSSSTPVSWTRGRHGYVCNIGMADGSVEEETSVALRNSIPYNFGGTPVATNRIAIP